MPLPGFSRSGYRLSNIIYADDIVLMADREKNTGFPSKCSKDSMKKGLTVSYKKSIREKSQDEN